MVHSGRGSDYHEDAVLATPAYGAAIREALPAQLGICGGHQIIAHYHGGTLGPMRALAPGAPDLFPEYHPGQFKEKGMFPVDIVCADPLFAGLSLPCFVSESHYWEVRDAGPGLEVIARNGNAAVQAYRHRTRPIYGVQFHPERSSEAYPAGRTILLNFFRLAAAAR
ncbi:MAG: gamma-glutamyl-gamma-aminobutyrate hydrolase family protein [Planctomycetota bacterium]